MLGGDKNAQAQMLLEKLMELFSGLPDEDMMPEPETKLEIAVEAEPKKEII